MCLFGSVTSCVVLWWKNVSGLRVTLCAWVETRFTRANAPKFGEPSEKFAPHTWTLKMSQVPTTWYRPRCELSSKRSCQPRFTRHVVGVDHHIQQKGGVVFCGRHMLPCHVSPPIPPSSLAKLTWMKCCKWYDWCGCECYDDNVVR